MVDSNICVFTVILRWISITSYPSLLTKDSLKVILSHAKQRDFDSRVSKLQCSGLGLA